MPVIVRWYVKSALVYLVLALGMELIRQGGAARWAAASVSWHLFAVGWLTQLIFGIALWMLPSFTREQPRRSDRLNWAILWTLNLGLILRAVVEPLPAFPARGGLLVVSALLQWLAGVGFVVNVWARVRGPRRRTKGGR